MKLRIQFALMATVFAAIFSGSLAAQTTVTFQQGVNGYNGSFDRLIGTSSSVTGNTVESVFIDGDPNDSARKDYLIRFDDIFGGTGIPTGATILDANLSVRTSSASSADSPESFSIYRLTQAFDGNSTLDGDFGDGDLCSLHSSMA